MRQLRLVAARATKAAGGVTGSGGGGVGKMQPASKGGTALASLVAQMSADPVHELSGLLSAGVCARGSGVLAKGVGS